MFTYTSIAELVEAAEKSGKKISELVLADQAESMEQSQEELFDRMSTDLDVMILAGPREGFPAPSSAMPSPGPFPWLAATPPWAGSWPPPQLAAAASCPVVS